MTQEELKEQTIQSLVEVLRIVPFSVEYKIVKKPKGINIIYEVTQEHLDSVIKAATQKEE